MLVILALSSWLKKQQSSVLCVSEWVWVVLFWSSNTWQQLIGWLYLLERRGFGSAKGVLVCRWFRCPVNLQSHSFFPSLYNKIHFNTFSKTGHSPSTVWRSISGVCWSLSVWVIVLRTPCKSFDQSFLASVLIPSRSLASQRANLNWKKKEKKNPIVAKNLQKSLPIQVQLIYSSWRLLV